VSRRRAFVAGLHEAPTRQTPIEKPQTQLLKGAMAVSYGALTPSSNIRRSRYYQ
jgi:hypothetical protein